MNFAVSGRSRQTARRPRKARQHRGAIFAGLLVSLLVVSCGGVTAATAPPTTSAAVAPYPAKVQTSFLHNCSAFGASQAGCACALKRIEARVPLTEWAVDELKLQYGTLSSRLGSPLGRAIALCAGQEGGATAAG